MKIPECPELDLLRAQSALLASIAESMSQKVATIKELQEWMKCANQFAWAHEPTCSKASGGVECGCGLDVFLARPRLFIGTWKAEVERLKGRLESIDDCFEQLGVKTVVELVEKYDRATERVQELEEQLAAGSVGS